MSNSIETAITIAFFGTIAFAKATFQLSILLSFSTIAIAIGIAKKIPKLTQTSFFIYLLVTASKSELHRMTL